MKGSFMNMAVSSTASRAGASHARPANFGALNSAIARGDMPAAQAAFTALTEAQTPAAAAAKAKGSLEFVGAAIAAGDVEGARKSLADLRGGRIPATNALPAEPIAVPLPVPQAPLPPVEQTASTVQILSLLEASRPSA